MSGFDLKLKLDGIRSGDRVDLVADDAERKEIADRLGLLSLERMEAHAMLERDGDGIHATGRLRASAEQACVITGDPVASRIDEPFDLLFRPEPTDIGADEEIELSPEDCDTVFHDGAAIDLGAAIADTLALAIDPYPRSAGADAALKEAGILSEAEAGPFAALAKLKRD
jgi:uncharacterized metal-binding protein YceD (DUF177 family)